MKAAHGDSDPSGPERSCNVESAGILLRLNAYERNTSEIVVTSKAAKERRDIDACVRFVDDLDVDGDVRPAARCSALIRSVRDRHTAGLVI
jgi:hypothetical protein